MSSSTSDFESYCQPPPLSAYSNNFFNSITFPGAASCDFPIVTPPGIIFDWTFQNDIPASASATLILPNEIVYHKDDLHKILQQMKDAFDNGSRSVAIEAFINGQKRVQEYHFAKVNYFFNCVLIDLSYLTV